jgi:hypothetical protein
MGVDVGTGDKTVVIIKGREGDKHLEVSFDKQEITFDSNDKKYQDLSKDRTRHWGKNRKCLFCRTWFPSQRVLNDHVAKSCPR